MNENEVANEKVKSIRRRLDGDSHIDDVKLSPYRDMMVLADGATNGRAGDIRNLSGLVASMAVVMAQDKLDEPARLKDTFLQAHTAVCPVMPLIHKNPDGTLNLPWPSRQEVTDHVEACVKEWTKELKTADAKTEAKSKPKTIGSMMRFGKDGVSATGAVAWGTLLLLFFIAFMYLRDGRRDTVIKSAVTEAVSTQIRAAINSTVNMEKAAESKEMSE